MTCSIAEHLMEMHYEDRTLRAKAGQSVLEALLAAGIETPFGCRAGVCQACLVKVDKGAIPPSAQRGLNDALARQHMALACRLPAQAGLSIRRSESISRIEAIVLEKVLLAERIWRLRLRCRQPFDYLAGQYLTLWNPQGAGRAYSLASVPGEDDFIELHVRHYPGGAVSDWVAGSLDAGDRVTIRGPAGACHHVSGQPERPLLLAGTGTGIAPLLGIARDALRQRHVGPVTVLHGARTREQLYLENELGEMTEAFVNFHYRGMTGDDLYDSLEACTMREVDNANRPIVYLCGGERFVHGLRKKLFLAGLPLNEILADAFLGGGQRVRGK